VRRRFFGSLSQASRLTIEEKGYASLGQLSMKSSITCPAPDVREMTVQRRLDSGHGAAMPSNASIEYF
jgi:hypothetical protein